jgi:hypothetical protein
MEIPLTAGRVAISGISPLAVGVETTGVFWKATASDTALQKEYGAAYCGWGHFIRR